MGLGSGIPGSKGTKSRIGICNTAVWGNTLVILPSLAWLEVKKEGIVVDESGGDSLVQKLGMPVKNYSFEINNKSLTILLLESLLYIKKLYR
jgi:hypothetical protein